MERTMHRLLLTDEELDVLYAALSESAITAHKESQRQYKLMQTRGAPGQQPYSYAMSYEGWINSLRLKLYQLRYPGFQPPPPTSQRTRTE